MMRWLSQTMAVTEVNLRSLRQRLGSSSVAVVGFAGVVAVFIAVLSIAEGFRKVMESGTSPGTALVLRAGSDTEMSSVLELELTRIIKDAPGVLRGSDGPLASAELFVIVDVPKRSTGTGANVPMRGVEPSVFEVRPQVKIVAGERFHEGRNEVIVGQAAAREFAGLEVGNTLHWGENVWHVVGVFSAGGSIYESEIWADVRVLQPAYRRDSAFQSVFAKLESGDAFQRFKDALTSDPRLEVDVQREDDYYAAQSQVLRDLVRTLGNAIALLMAVGATFGALNTMYSAVAVRGQEIATLRALGFQGGPVLVSVMAESLLLAVLGGLLGGGIAYLVANGYHTATMNFQTFSQVAFSLAVTPRLLVGGIAYALAMGFLGGIFPALHAVRAPIATGLRNTV
jgi:putative ABC transport system permease protein